MGTSRPVLPAPLPVCPSAASGESRGRDLELRALGPAFLRTGGVSFRTDQAALNCAAH